MSLHGRTGKALCCFLKKDLLLDKHILSSLYSDGEVFTDAIQPNGYSKAFNELWSCYKLITRPIWNLL